MMAEALSLASSIVQFVDFANKLVTKANALYKSAHQASTGSLVLQEVANDLTRLSNAVITSDSLMGCMQFKGQKTKWKSFLLAMKEICNEETVAAITSSMSRLQMQMTLHFQFQIGLSLSGDTHTTKHEQSLTTQQFQRNQEAAVRPSGGFQHYRHLQQELIDGLTYNDTIKTMRQRVDSFPDTLEEFFQHMLDSIPKVYRPHAARIFQISTSYDLPLPMILYSFLEDINDDASLIA
ncbi:hypothetical protein RRF57_003729 [Xylaria bambusicola]|uniref:Uncharacterized protein n=1 Tax=Xylaria bambusicola TaxID=326684 RepID=A0AAN7UFI5_9PEZI